MDPRTLVLVALLCLLAGCASIGRLPRQYVLASTPATPLPQGVLVNTCRSADGVQWSCLPLQGEGGVAPVQRARPATPPALAANGEIYVAAWWAAPPGFNSLQLAVSGDGSQWSFTNLLTGIAASADVDLLARLALAYHPARHTWFVAYPSASTHTVWLGELDIVCVPDGRGGCATDSRGAPRYTARLIGAMRDTGLAVARAPTLVVFDGAVLLAGRDTGGTGRVLLQRSPDGLAFTALTPVSASDGSALVSESTPYLNNSLGSLYLLVTRLNAAGAESIEVWTSADARRWQLQRVVPTVGAALLGPYDPAAAGPETEMVIAHATPGRASTTLLVPGGSRTLPTDTHAAVALAHGP